MVAELVEAQILGKVRHYFYPNKQKQLFFVFLQKFILGWKKAIVYTPHT